jgi:hypothetical protein
VFECAQKRGIIRREFAEFLKDPLKRKNVSRQWNGTGWETYVALSGCHSSGKVGVLELDWLEEIFGRLGSSPRYPDDMHEIHSIVTVDKLNYRFAWLMIPFPLKIGMTEVDAVLNEMIIPSESNADLRGGRLLW